MSYKGYVLIPILLALQGTTGQDNTTAAADPGESGSSEVIPKAVITVVVISAAFAIGMIVAKLVDMVYDRQAIRDDASDISEYTKDLLKLQFMVAFNKKNKFVKESPEDIARRMTKLWRIGVAKKKAQRKLDAKRAALKAKQKGFSPNDKASNAADDKKPTGVQLLSVKSFENPTVKLTTINEKEKNGNDRTTDKQAKSDKEKKDDNNTTVTTHADNSQNKEQNEKQNKDTESESKAGGKEQDIEHVDSKQSENGGHGITSTGNLTNGAKPGGTRVGAVTPLPHKDFVEFRADSEDLMIPVSTDENPKPTLKVTSGRRQSITSSKSDYEFLKDPDDGVKTARSQAEEPGLVKTPSSLSGVKLESKSRDTQKVNSKPPGDTPKSRPETARSRAGPISARPKSAAPPLITPTGRRPVSGKIVTPQGVKVVSRPKTPSNTTKH